MSHVRVSDPANFAFWDLRRPWRLAATVVLCVAAFVPFWLLCIILSLGVAAGGLAVVSVGVLSALAAIAAFLDWRDRRRRYPAEERGSFRNVEGLGGAIAVLAAVAAVVLFGAWAWNMS